METKVEVDSGDMDTYQMNLFTQHHHYYYYPAPKVMRYFLFLKYIYKRGKPAPGQKGQKISHHAQPYTYTSY
jgi:hypothetical protein